MEEFEARRRFAAASVARLATTRPDGAAHIVPVVFAVDGDRIYTPVDHKPKRGAAQLQRLMNLRHEPRCALLADHYDDDWSRLWWVRADGRAVVVDAPADDHVGRRLLTARYPVYEDIPLSGAIIVVTVAAWTGWQAA